MLKTPGVGFKCLNIELRGLHGIEGIELKELRRLYHYAGVHVGYRCNCYLNQISNDIGLGVVLCKPLVSAMTPDP